MPVSFAGHFAASNMMEALEGIEILMKFLLTPQNNLQL
ncbi:hypothetical protein J2Z20_003007 [Paenibacillus sediminis]|uniref:Uncharacterized protein n=1 Tax=Paenibacillus sediminis TaxID=664909 RepID=A0ABS4H6C4_9BACL|nr:hypothetical protein [Paenibacillus sediminis]